jgi:hypothetical protein
LTDKSKKIAILFSAEAIYQTLEGGDESDLDQDGKDEGIYQALEDFRGSVKTNSE